ncbi:MAG TPA: hypothetical protein HA263_08035 [Methanoregulaceae archaeon]|nr:hypothetical protein [Methanoregulaceae archaeon]
MAATVPTAFDPKPRAYGVMGTYIAGAAILAGQIVAFAAAGEDRIVHPATSSLGSPVGVAAYTVAINEAVLVYGNGCEVLVELSADDGTADAGDWLGVSTVAGMAIVQDGAIAAHASEGVGLFPIGQAQVNIAAGAATVGGKGYVLLNMVPVWTAAA